jgi:hypothetical protein
MGSCKDTARTVRELCFTFGVKHADQDSDSAGDEETAAELDKEALSMI